jgi:hypothetical protein
MFGKIVGGIANAADNTATESFFDDENTEDTDFFIIKSSDDSKIASIGVLQRVI